MLIQHPFELPVRQGAGLNLSDAVSSRCGHVQTVQLSWGIIASRMLLCSVDLLAHIDIKSTDRGQEHTGILHEWLTVG